MRALLLAMNLPNSTTPDEFWRHFASDEQPLGATVVLDPFAGGGSTLVEAARLGAVASGADVDPMAVRIVRRTLAPAPANEVLAAGTDLLSLLRDELGQLYPDLGRRRPLHYFSLAEVTCPTCSTCGVLYRDLVIARDTGSVGAVVRDHAMTVFCPDCARLHSLGSVERTRLHCCGRYHRVLDGTYTGASYECEGCGARWSHRALHTGSCPRHLIAIEATSPDERRSFHRPRRQDLDAIERASTIRKELSPRYPAPLGEFDLTRRDKRPASFGIERYDNLFTDRQLLVLGRAFEWLRAQHLDPVVRDALELAVSNALTTNNRLCGYATDYGRLSALFSVRGYSLPVLSVELNPLHPDAGRGTIAACIERVARSASTEARRYVWDTAGAKPKARTFTFPAGSSARVEHCNAEAPVGADDQGIADTAVFDPPYFDFIAYDELSAFHRAWLPGAELAGEPLLPAGDVPVESFGLRLGTCLRQVLMRLKRGRPLAFTYHSADEAAWQAVGLALDEAKLRVTAAWPVRSDGHMGHHSHPGNCEWDVVLVCRPVTDTVPRRLGVRVQTWIDGATPFAIGDADRANFRLALAVAGARFGSAIGDNP
jgi:adenine-specific DNA methylase